MPALPRTEPTPSNAAVGRRLDRSIGPPLSLARPGGDGARTAVRVTAVGARQGPGRRPGGKAAATRRTTLHPARGAARRPVAFRIPRSAPGSVAAPARRRAAQRHVRGRLPAPSADPGKRRGPHGRAGERAGGLVPRKDRLGGGWSESTRTDSDRFGRGGRIRVARAAGRAGPGRAATASSRVERSASALVASGPPPCASIRHPTTAVS